MFRITVGFLLFAISQMRVSAIGYNFEFKEHEAIVNLKEEVETYTGNSVKLTCKILKLITKSKKEFEEIQPQVIQKLRGISDFLKKSIKDLIKRKKDKYICKDADLNSIREQVMLPGYEAHDCANELISKIGTKVQDIKDATQELSTTLARIRDKLFDGKRFHWWKKENHDEIAKDIVKLSQKAKADLRSLKETITNAQSTIRLYTAQEFILKCSGNEIRRKLNFQVSTVLSCLSEKVNFADSTSGIIKIARNSGSNIEEILKDAFGSKIVSLRDSIRPTMDQIKKQCDKFEQKVQKFLRIIDGAINKIN